MEDIQKAVKSSSLFPHICKTSHLLTQGFEKNRTAQEKIFKHMYNFGEREEWMEGRFFLSFYLDVETAKDQCPLLNTMTLDCIAGYIMNDAVGDRDLNRLPQRRLNCMDGNISSYCSILNSTERLEQIRQAKKLASVLYDFESDIMREKYENKKRGMEAEEIEGGNLKIITLVKTSTG